MGVIRTVIDLGNGYQEVTADLTDSGQVTVTIPVVLPSGVTMEEAVRLAVGQADNPGSIPRIGGRDRKRGSV